MRERGTHGGKARDRLMSTADRLFYAGGIHATGIDSILAESGVAKMTLYNHFGSKEALVEEYLRHRDEEWLPAFQDAVRGASRSSRGRLLAVFDLLGSWLEGDGHRGCALLNASVEFPDRAHPVRRVVAEKKALLEEFFAELAKDAGARRPKELATQLVILMHGVIAWHLISGSPGSAKAAGKAAKTLIDASLPSQG